MTRSLMFLASSFACAVTVGAVPVAQQSVHPAKAGYVSRADWPIIAPGDVTLNGFRPFRAVYERHYVQGLGPRAGEPRTDRVIVTAEDVGWDGAEAVAIQLIDSGVPGQDDTNARALTMFIARRDLTLLFEMGPIPGKAKDYYLVHVLADQIAGSLVTTATAEIEPMLRPFDAPGFGPTAWVMANMDLRTDLRFRVEPAYSPQANPLAPGSFGRVIGRETFTDLADASRDAWVVETVTNLENERASRHYLVREPPYYLGTASWNLDTDEERHKYVWLQSFTFLEGRD